MSAQVFYDWRPPVEADRLEREIFMYTRMLDLPNMNDECEVFLIARLSACFGQELTSDGVPWLDFCQVPDPMRVN